MKQINDCCYKGQTAKLAEYLHENFVLNSRDLKHQSTGKDNSIQSYVGSLE